MKSQQNVRCVPQNPFNAIFRIMQVSSNGCHEILAEFQGYWYNSVLFGVCIYILRALGIVNFCDRWKKRPPVANNGITDPSRVIDGLIFGFLTMDIEGTLKGFQGKLEILRII